MTLHVFNPEHDIALAANLSNFTAPHAGRQLRADLCWLPALWVAADDVVLVEHVEYARKAFRRKKAQLHLPECHFVDRTELARLPISAVQPWGWDLALRAQLLRYGVTAVPSEEEIAEIRRLSHRRMAAQLLSVLHGGATLGEMTECRSVAEVVAMQEHLRHIVVKAPWSSSGRGVRFWSRACEVTSNERWLSHVLDAQGSVMVEPYYNKVKDFGMEFEAQADGTVCYRGLSLFHTTNGAYTGNVLATEAAKRELLSRYVAEELLEDTQQTICRELAAILNGKYVGPLGVDMMICAVEDKWLLHPCVEINLRRTMGHVALALTPDEYVRRTMRIDYNGTNYKLKVNKL